MILDKNFQERVRKMLNDPVFDKPIQNKEFTKKGSVKLITKIKLYAN